MRRPWTLVALVLAVGLAGTVVALKGREGNPAFVSAQQSLTAVAPAALDRLLLTTSDPRPGYSGRARSAQCSSDVHTALGNPWRCVVGYVRPPRVRYVVAVHSDRSIQGSGQPEGAPLKGALVVHGCCVAQTP
ncbi:MAG TPA: hypothetical protein VID70_09710 [Solirubrobacteraceae bacterium]|jgi:hypothetical protein